MTSPRTHPRPVLLLTDFGLLDDFAGVMHSVIALRAPGAQVIHLTHGITPQDVLQGALVLRGAVPYTPPHGVVLAVVDPGVGTDRRGLALEATDGRCFVGPDNGLLIPAVERCGGIASCVSLESDAHQLHPRSSTFHGRDVFAPAAAHLAAGGPLADLGPAVTPASLVRLDIPEPRPSDHGLVVRVWSVDRFGNASLHLDEAGLSALMGDSTRAELLVRNDRYFAQLASTFANVRSGELLLYVDPYGSAAVAVNRGNASAMFGIEPGDEIAIRPV